MRLTKDEFVFLQRHNLTAADVFDGTAYRTKDWQRLMQVAGKPLTARSEPCIRGGHRIVDRYNHCIQCSPASLEYVARYYRDGFIYIAGSLEIEALKIGMSNNLSQREYKLLFDAYGGATDWELLFHMKVPRAGRVERDATRSLARYSVTANYLKDGAKTQKAIEIVRCSYANALNAIYEASTTALSDPWQSPRHIFYSFG